MGAHDSRLALAMAAAMVLSVVAVATPVAASHGGGGDLAVETGPATDVTESSARLQGNLTHLNVSDDEAAVSFELWAAGDRANSTTYEAGDLDETGEFRTLVAALDPGTEYAYQAYAEADNATVNGSVQTFTTAEREIELSVATEAASNITNSSARLNGNLTALDGNATDTEVWFQYWVAGDRSTTERTDRMAVNDTGAFSATVTGLAADETYTVRAHAETNASDVNYTADDRGAELSFTTLGGPLAVETTGASDVTNDSATLNGELTGLNGSSAADVAFEYWVEGDAGNASTVDAGSLGAPGAFSAEVSGLDNDTTYVYVAQVSAGGDNASGATVAFTTDDGDTPTWNGSGPFGQFVSEVVQQVKADADDDQPLGQVISEIVTENNPGQGPPAHAGPPEHAGPGGEDDNETETEGNETEEEPGPPANAGPPEDAGPPANAGPGGEDDNETEDDDNETRGPPADAGPPAHAGPGGEDDNETETEGNETRGPPADAGPPEHAGPGGEDNETESESGPPAHAGPGGDDDNETEENETESEPGPPANAGPGGENETEGNETETEPGPPANAGPGSDDESEEEQEGTEEQEETEEEEEESGQPGNGGGPPGNDDDDEGGNGGGPPGNGGGSPGNGGGGGPP